MLEEGAERFIFFHRARELGEVFEASGAFGRAVGLEHRRVAGLSSSMMRASSGWGRVLAISPPACEIGDEIAERAARLRSQLVAVEQVRCGNQQRLLALARAAGGSSRPPCRRGRAWAC